VAKKCFHSKVVTKLQPMPTFPIQAELHCFRLLDFYAISLVLVYFKECVLGSSVFSGAGVPPFGEHMWSISYC